MKKIYQYILMAVALVATASCSNELDEALQPVGNGTLQFVVGDFPAFGEGAATRAIGFENEGKTAWEDNDKILVHLYSQEYGNQAVKLTFRNGDWNSDGGTLSYLKDENPTITAVYAPDCEIKEGQIVLQEGKQYGMAEYIQAQTTISGNTLDIRFESGRSYSRLRLATMPGATLTVEFTGFTPAGASEATSTQYSLTADDDGNAYLYGTFAINGTVTATAKHEIYPTDGITKTSRTTAFDDKPSTSGESYVLGVKLGDWVDAVRAERGDVALKDGSFVSNANIGSMTTKQKDAMVGIVFWTTVETDLWDESRVYPAKLTDDKVMNADFPHCTHGLIVSLTNTEAMAWQDEEESVWENFQSTSNEYSPDNSDYVSIYQLSTGDGNYYKILGYQNTRILEAYNDDCNAQNRTAYIVKPITQLSSYSDKNPAPFGSTGWYLPSIKELHMLCNKDVDDKNETGTNCKTTLNNLLSELNMDILTDQTYWSSTENNNNAACVVNFVTGANSYPRKMVPNYIIRYVCAF